MTNISMRTSHLAAFMIQWFINRIQPQTDRARRALELLARHAAESQLGPTVTIRICLAVVGFYIDDFATATIAGHEAIVTQIQSAVWEIFGLPEEPTKTDGFHTK